MGARGRLLALAGLAALLWALYLKFSFVGFAGDAVYYLEPARNAAKGLGIVTRILYPAQIAAFREGPSLPAPFLWHGPLAPAAIGFLYRVFGFSDCVPLVFAFGLTLAAGLLSWKWGRELGGVETGALSAGLLWSSALLMERNTGSLMDPLFIFLVAAAAAFLWESAKGKDAVAWCAAAGAALGLSALARLSWQTYWPGFFLAALWLHRGRKPAAALMGGLAAGALALAIYNKAAAGVWLHSPGFYMLLYSKNFPGVSAQTSFMGDSTFATVLAHPRDVLQKMVTGPLYGVLGWLTGSRGPYLTAAILLGLLTDFKADKAASRFKNFALILVLPPALVNLAIANGAVDYLLPAFPFLVVVAALFLRKFVTENLPWLARRPVLAGAALAYLFLTPAALEIKDAWKTRDARRRHYADQKALGEFLKARAGPGEVLYSDDPPTVLWHSERPAILLGRTLADTEAAMSRIPADGLVLTSMRVDSTDYDPAFRLAFRDRKPVLGFEPCTDFQSPTITAVLYRKPGRCRKES